MCAAVRGCGAGDGGGQGRDCEVGRGVSTAEPEEGGLIQTFGSGV